ncbi:hypothetical protein L9F63_000918, partial [Diploptera punctata]
ESKQPQLTFSVTNATERAAGVSTSTIELIRKQMKAALQGPKHLFVFGENAVQDRIMK